MNEEKQITPMARALKDSINVSIFPVSPLYHNSPYGGYWHASWFNFEPHESFGLVAAKGAGDSLPVDQPTPLYTLEQAREIITAEYNAKINKQ